MLDNLAVTQKPLLAEQRINCCFPIKNKLVSWVAFGLADIQVPWTCCFTLFRHVFVMYFNLALRLRCISHCSVPLCVLWNCHYYEHFSFTKRWQLHTAHSYACKLLTLSVGKCIWLASCSYCDDGMYGDFKGFVDGFEK